MPKSDRVLCLIISIKYRLMLYGSALLVNLDGGFDIGHNVKWGSKCVRFALGCGRLLETLRRLCCAAPVPAVDAESEVGGNTGQFMF